MIAGLGQVQDRQRLGRLAGRHRERSHTPLERADPLLENVLRGVHDPGVDVAGLTEGEQRGGMVGVPEDVARRLVDRDRTRPGRRVRLGAGVDLAGLERPAFC